MKKKLKYKLVATSLVETLIASVISAICFSVGLMIYINVLKSGFSNLKTEAKLYIEKDIQISIEQNKFKSENTFLEHFLLANSVEFYQKKDDLLIIKYLVKNSKGKTILEQNALKYIEK